MAENYMEKKMKPPPLLGAYVLGLMGNDNTESNALPRILVYPSGYKILIQMRTYLSAPSKTISILSHNKKYCHNQGI